MEGWAGGPQSRGGPARPLLPGMEHRAWFSHLGRAEGPKFQEFAPFQLVAPRKFPPLKSWFVWLKIPGCGYFVSDTDPGDLPTLVLPQ